MNRLAPAAVVAYFAVLRLGGRYNLLVAIEPRQTELLGGLGLQGPHSSTSSWTGIAICC